MQNIEADTEIIAVCDGNWPDPPLADNPRVKLIYHPVPIGQRAATNEAARLSTAKYIMKCDAHCAFDKGFDRKLMEHFEPDWTVVPRMYNLHAFNWRCLGCGNETYQGPKPVNCEKCHHNEFEMVIVWKPRLHRRTDFMRFDKDLKFGYWQEYERRPQAKEKIAEQMCAVGACWMMSRERFWELDGVDEHHGSWGQMGVEIACKSWLSGGKQVVNKHTWFSHMFRTNNAGFSFPYPISGKEIEYARKHSRKMWMERTWPKAKYNLQWLIDKFAPVPTWG
jgi:hypothetical protein